MLSPSESAFVAQCEDALEGILRGDLQRVEGVLDEVDALGLTSLGTAEQLAFRRLMSAAQAQLDATREALSEVRRGRRAVAGYGR